MRKLFQYTLFAILLLFTVGTFQSCAKKKCITYTNSTTTGKLKKSVKKKDKSYKKKAKKGGKMKTGKPLL